MYQENDSTGSAEELVAVVDVDGRVLDRVVRQEIRAKNLLHPAVAAICRDPADRIFVHRRSATKDLYPGMYDMFVTGVVRAGESYLAAVRRELAEELDVVGARPRWLFDHLYMGEYDRSLIAVYEVRWRGPVHPQRSEISEGRFVTLEELHALTAHAPFVPDSLEVFPLWRAIVDHSGRRHEERTGAGG